MIKILIVNYYQSTRELYEYHLNSQADFQVVEVCKGKGDLLKMIKKSNPDIILTGLYFGDEKYNGLDIISEIQEHFPYLKILIVSAYNDVSLLDIIKDHHVNYCSKNTSLAEIVNSLKKINEGHKIVKFNYKRTAKDLSPMLLNRNENELTKKRLDIIKMLADGEITKNIAAKLEISETTAIDHIKKMRQKYNVKNKCELIAYAFRNDLIR